MSGFCAALLDQLERDLAREVETLAHRAQVIKQVDLGLRIGINSVVVRMRSAVGVGGPINGGRSRLINSLDGFIIHLLEFRIWDFEFRISVFKRAPNWL